MKAKFQVEFEIPEGASMGEAFQYTLDALTVHSGSLEYDEDPMFDLDRETISVKNVPAKVPDEP